MATSNDVDLGGLDLHVNSIYAGATTPGATGTNISSAEIGVLDAATSANSGTGKALITGTSGALTVAGALGVAAPVTVTSASASALAVGLTGATNSAFNVDASTASQVAGLKVTGAATGGTVAVVATDSGSNTNLIVNAKGTGTIGIGSVSTGAVTITPATTVTGVLTATGGITTVAGTTLKSGTAVPATAGAVAAGAPITCFSSNWKLWVTSDAPTHTATKGDLCINTGGSSTSTRLYVNNGTTTWIAITTAS